MLALLLYNLYIYFSLRERGFLLYSLFAACMGLTMLTGNGIAQNNAPDNTRAMLGTTYLSDDKTQQWIFRAAQDTVVRNGFMTGSEVMLRYLNMF